MRWDDVFYKWNIGGLCGGTTCSTSGTSEVYVVGRRVLQVEHRRFIWWDDVFYKWNIGGLCGGTTCSTSGTSEVYEVGRRVLQVEHQVQDSV